MLKVFFQHIPRCLFEALAVLCVVGFVFFLCRHWKKNKAETILFAATFCFMIAWRMVMPINADRYALILVPFAIYFSVTAIVELAAFFGKYFCFPQPKWFLCILLLVCMVKSWSGNPEDRQIFAMLELIKADAKDAKKPLRLVSNRDVSCFLGDDFKVLGARIRGTFRYAELPDADYYLLKLNPKKVPLDENRPDLVELKRTSHPVGHSTFVLKKKVRR